MDSTANKHPKLNEVAMWKPAGTKEVSSRVYKANRTYLNNGVLGVASYEKPVYRYVKSYEKSGEKFSLFVFSGEPNMAEIEKTLDACAKKATKKQVLEVVASASESAFKYVGVKHGDK